MSQFEPPPSCEIPQTQQYRTFLIPRDRSTDQLHQPPSRCCYEPNFDRVTDFFALDTQQGENHELEILRMDEFEARNSYRAVECATEEEFGRMIRPHHSTLCVNDDCRIRQVDK